MKVSTCQHGHDAYYCKLWPGPRTPPDPDLQTAGVVTNLRSCFGGPHSLYVKTPLVCGRRRLCVLALSMAGLVVINMKFKLELTSDWALLSGAAQSLGISRWAATGALLADAGVAGLAGNRVSRRLQYANRVSLQC